MNNKPLVFAVVALLAGLAGYFLAMVLNPAGGPDAKVGGQQQSGPVTARNVQDLLGELRPDFTLNDVNGMSVSASDFDGAAWLVNFWATWCKPCVEEMPMLSRLQQDYSDRGFRVVGIALDDPQRASDFAAGLEIEYTVLVGRTDVVLTGRRFGNATGMLPFSVLVDADGIVRWAHLGALSRDELQHQIDLLQ